MKPKGIQGHKLQSESITNNQEREISLIIKQETRRWIQEKKEEMKGQDEMIKKENQSIQS